jgi:hypothetical protein
VHLKWQKAGKLTVINAVDRTVISKYMRKRLLGCKWKNQEKNLSIQHTSKKEFHVKNGRNSLSFKQQ